MISILGNLGLARPCPRLGRARMSQQLTRCHHIIQEHCFVKVTWVFY